MVDFILKGYEYAVKSYAKTRFVRKTRTALISDILEIRFFNHKRNTIEYSGKWLDCMAILQEAYAHK